MPKTIDQVMMNKQQQQIERIRSLCSISTLIFVGCISTLTYCTTKQRMEEARAKQKPASTIVTTKASIEE